jgi:hypothetical protein
VTRLSPQAMMAMGFRQANAPKPRPMPQGTEPLLDLYMQNPAAFQERFPGAPAEASEGGASRINQLRGQDILSDEEVAAARQLWAEQNPQSTVQQFMQWLATITPRVP